MTTHADLTEGSDQRIVADRALGEWADRLLEQAGLGVTIVDRSLVQRLAQVAHLARGTLAHGLTTATDPRADGAGNSRHGVKCAVLGNDSSTPTRER